MAKIYSYGSVRTAPTELIATDATDLKVGDLAVVTNGKIAKAGASEPTYLVVGVTTKEQQVHVTAILDDMILESEEEITGYQLVGENLYRK